MLVTVLHEQNMQYVCHGEYILKVFEPIKAALFQVTSKYRYALTMRSLRICNFGNSVGQPPG